MGVRAHDRCAHKTYPRTQAVAAFRECAAYKSFSERWKLSFYFTLCFQVPAVACCWTTPCISELSPAAYPARRVSQMLCFKGNPPCSELSSQACDASWPLGLLPNKWPGKSCQAQPPPASHAPQILLLLKGSRSAGHSWKQPPPASHAPDFLLVLRGSRCAGHSWKPGRGRLSRRPAAGGAYPRGQQFAVPPAGPHPGVAQVPGPVSCPATAQVSAHCTSCSRPLSRQGMPKGSATCLCSAKGQCAVFSA